MWMRAETESPSGRVSFSFDCISAGVKRSCSKHVCLTHQWTQAAQDAAHNEGNDLRLRAAGRLKSREIRHTETRHGVPARGSIIAAAAWSAERGAAVVPLGDVPECRGGALAVQQRVQEADRGLASKGASTSNS